MIFNNMNNPFYLLFFYIIIGIVFVICELFTTQLIFLMFAISMFISIFFVYSFYISLMVFSISNIILLIFIRPILKNMLNKRKTNYKSALYKLLNSNAVVVEKINNDKGLIKYKGELWKARSHNSSTILVNKTVCIVGIKSGILEVKEIDD